MQCLNKVTRGASRLTQTKSKTAAVRNVRGAKRTIRYNSSNRLVNLLKRFQSKELTPENLKSEIDMPNRAELQEEEDRTFWQNVTPSAIDKLVNKFEIDATLSKLLADTAKRLDKAPELVTANEVSETLIQWRDEVVQKVDISQTPLFSNKSKLSNYNEAKKALRDAPDASDPRFVNLVAEREQELIELAENEEIMELEVDEDVFQSVQSNLFPTFADKEITPQEITDYLRGFAIYDFPGDPQPKELVTVAVAKAAEESISKKLGRPVKLHDVLNPLSRMDSSVDNFHPVLSSERKIYYAGTLVPKNPLTLYDLKDLDKEELKVALEEATDEYEFLVNEAFNPETQFRPIPENFVDEFPDVAKKMQKAVLDFTLWEGDQVNQPRNATEQIIKLKLWKFFNFIHPRPHEDRLRFAEEFDISPGERTLEWTLAYPPPDHTFTESPVIKETEEDVDDIDVDPAALKAIGQWPKYSPAMQTLIWDSDLVSEIDDHGHKMFHVKTNRVLNEARMREIEIAYLSMLKKTADPEELPELEEELGKSRKAYLEASKPKVATQQIE